MRSGRMMYYYRFELGTFPEYLDLFTGRQHTKSCVEIYIAVYAMFSSVLCSHPHTQC